MTTWVSQIRQLFRMRFVRELLILQAGKFIPLLSGLISSIVFVRLLGLGGYGQYAVVMAFTGVVGLFTNLGQRFTTLTFFAEAYGRHDKNAMRAVSNYYVILSVGTMALLTTLFFILPQVTLWIYGQEEMGRLARLVFAASFFDPFFLYFCIALQTVREIRTLTFWENMYTATQLVIGLLFLLQGMGPAGLLWASLLTSIVSAVAAISFYPRLAKRYDLPSYGAIVSYRGIKHLWKYTKNGIWIAADKSLSNLYPNLFLFVLSLRSSEPVVGLVRLAIKFAGLPASFVLSNIGRLAASVIPALSAKGVHLGKELRKLLRYTFLLHAGVSAAAAIVVPLIFPLVYGNSFGSAIYPFWVVLAAQLILPLHAITTPLFRLHDKSSLTALQNSVAILIGMAAFFLLAVKLPATWSLYIAIGLYHATAVFLIIPASALLRTPPPSSLQPR